MPNNDASKQQIRRRDGRDGARTRGGTLLGDPRQRFPCQQKEAGMEIEYGKIRRPPFVFPKRRPFRVFFLPHLGMQAAYISRLKLPTVP